MTASRVDAPAPTPGAPRFSVRDLRIMAAYLRKQGDRGAVLFSPEQAHTWASALDGAADAWDGRA